MGRFSDEPAAVSDSPYPSRISSPAAWNHSASFLSRAADPDTKNRIRPPKRSRIFDSTKRSAVANCAASNPLGSLPAWRSADTRAPTPNAQWKSRALTPPSDSIIVTIRACAFSKIRGAAAMKVGWTIAALSTILSIRPSTAVANPIWH